MAGFILAWAAFRQARTATRQAEIARLRHEAQTKAHFRRRITETYSKAVSQLASDKLEERLGGIYTLESISKESPDDYWTVMETLTAFVRERSQQCGAKRMSQDDEQRIARSAYFLWQQAGQPDGQAEDFCAEALKRDQLAKPLATDIDAALIVIKRRVEQNRQNWERERTNDWRFDLSWAVLERAVLLHMHLERATLFGTHLEWARLSNIHLEEAYLWHAHFEGANLWGAHFERADLAAAHLDWADLKNAHFEGAFLWDAHLKKARLRNAHFEGASFWGAHFEGADLTGAHFEGADLRTAKGLSTDQLRDAHGDGATRLPDGVRRPAHWPAEEDDDDPDLTCTINRILTDYVR